MPRARPLRLALAAAALAAACAQRAPAPGGGAVPVDPSRPGDLLFAEGLGHYGAADRAAAAQRAAAAAGDAATAAARQAEAVGAYGLARDAFTRLRRDATLCPGVSIRCDNAAYLGGRCSYEVGSLTGDPAAFQDAVARLDAALADFPLSPHADSAAYFDGRARFHLADGLGLASFADAEILFERALAIAPTGTWADNALYYDGRCEFELGIALVTPLSPAAGTAGFAQARSWFGQAAAALSQLPVRFPASSYRDNAAYYLGRSWFEKPCDTATPAGDAERQANLGSAIAALGPVAADAASTFRPGALYWRGRASYARAGYAAAPAADLASALADFHGVAATSTYRDNALAYAVRTQVRQGSCAGACADLTALRAAYPASSYTASAATSYAASGCATIACP